MLTMTLVEIDDRMLEMNEQPIDTGRENSWQNQNLSVATGVRPLKKEQKTVDRRWGWNIKGKI